MNRKIIIYALFSICWLNNCMTQELYNSICPNAIFYTKDSVRFTCISIRDSTIEDSLNGAACYIVSLLNENGMQRIENVTIHHFFLGKNRKAILSSDKTEDINAFFNYYITPILLEGYFSCDNIYQIPHSRFEMMMTFTINKDNTIENVIELSGSFFEGEKKSLVKMVLQ